MPEKVAGGCGEEEVVEVGRELREQRKEKE